MTQPEATTAPRPVGGWEILERASKALSTLAIPVVLAVGGWKVQASIEDQGVRRDYVVLAVSILKEPDADKQMRSWAVDLLNANAPTPFGAEVDKGLKDGRLALPATATLSPTPLPATLSTGQGETKADAVGWETKGFMLLLAQDAPGALSAFAHAEELWPTYHNLQEIRALLRERQAALVDPTAGGEAWKALYATILKHYSWGMAPETEQQFALGAAK